MPEWSIGVVSKTIVPQGTGGSNPSLSANLISWTARRYHFVPFLFLAFWKSENLDSTYDAAVSLDMLVIVICNL